MIKQTVLGFKLERTDEALTAHGGLALMAEYNRRLGLREWVDQFLPGPGSNRGYAPSVFVESLVMMLQGGGRHLEDLRELGRERALMELIGLDQIPDPDTTGDWLRRMGDTAGEQAGLTGLGGVRDRITHRILEQDGLTEYTLDADATGVVAEKRDAEWTYKGHPGYMPMLGFLFETSVCLLDEFREGNVPPQAKQTAFYESCKEKMPAGKRIARYRADSASYQAALINRLELDSVRWAITADQDVAVKRLIRGISEGEWKEPKEGCGYAVAETVHTMNETRKAFRMIVKRWWKAGLDFEGEGSYAYHAVASNVPEEKNAFEVLAWHNQRGQAENFNKELKIGFGMEQMPCGSFGANAVFFRIGVIAYNLFIGFKRNVCPAACQSQTIGTFRWRLIQVAGRIVRHAGRIILRLSVDAQRLMAFEEIRRRSAGLSFAT
jgi:hypothetical protein